VVRNAFTVRDTWLADVHGPARGFRARAARRVAAEFAASQLVISVGRALDALTFEWSCLVADAAACAALAIFLARLAHMVVADWVCRVFAVFAEVALDARVAVVGVAHLVLCGAKARILVRALDATMTLEANGGVLAAFTRGVARLAPADLAIEVLHAEASAC
jgi:hypothetical protein